MSRGYDDAPLGLNNEFKIMLKAALKEAAEQIVQQVTLQVRQEFQRALSHSQTISTQPVPDTSSMQESVAQSADSSGAVIMRGDDEGFSQPSRPSPVEIVTRISLTNEECERDEEPSTDVRRSKVSNRISSRLSARPRSSMGEAVSTPLIEEDPNLQKILQEYEDDKDSFAEVEGEMSGPPTCAEEWVASSSFGYTAGIAVVLNCLCMGVEANVQSKSNGHVAPGWKIFIQIEGLLFCLFFAAELAMRVAAYGLRFFSVDTWMWNMFDTFIVGCQVADQTVTLLGNSSNLGTFGVARLLRLLRLFRIMRIARLLNIFEDVGILVSSISKSVKAIFWALVLMLVMIYSFAVLFTEMVNEIDVYPMNKDLKYWFGNLPRTALTLLESIMGGVSWDEPVVVLIDNVGIVSAMFFLFYISIGFFVMLNAVTGFFVDKTIQTAAQEADFRTARSISAALIDGSDEDAEFAWDDFKMKLHEPALLEFFNLLSVDTDEAETLFQVIDADGSGTVDAQEIVTACMRLKGTATAWNVAVLHRRTEHLHAKMDEHTCKIEKQLEMLGARLGIRFSSEPHMGPRTMHRRLLRL